MIPKLKKIIGSQTNSLDIRSKLAMIVIASTLLTAIPASILVYKYARNKILETEIAKLSYELQFQATEVDEFLAESKPRLEHFAKLLQVELAKPYVDNDIAEFNQTLELNSDGVWRNQKQMFNGAIESGIFIPLNAQLSDTQKMMHLRIKKVMDAFGAAATSSQQNIWYLSNDRTEIIFDTKLPNFVFDQSADNDYTKTPWVVNTSPDKNPTRVFGFTPPLYDPVPKVWMVSGIYPLYLGNQWLGSIGEDVLLSDVLNHMRHGFDTYKGTQHFLLDKQNNFILVGDWQKELESSTNAAMFKLADQPKLNALFKDLVHPKPRLLSKDLEVFGKTYIAIGIGLNVVGWRHYVLVPKDEILQSTRQLFYAIVAIIFFSSIVCGFLIASSVNSTVVKRIRRLADAMKLYESGQGHHISSSLQGTDDISQAAKEFDIMIDRIDQHMQEVEVARDLLQDSERRWRFALEGARDGVWEFDFKTKTCVMSPRMMEILGLDPSADDNTMSFDEIKSDIHPDSIASTMSAFSALIRGKSNRYVVEQQVRSKGGTYIWLLSRGMVVSSRENGKPISMIGTSLDITERKQTEDALIKAHAKYQNLVENIGNEYYFYSHDAQGVFNFVSASVTQMLGWTPEEFQVHHTKYLTNNPINNQCLILTAAGLKGEKQQSYLVERLHKDGSTRWLELNETPVFDEKGKVTGLEGIAHDVTARIEAEAKLKLAASVFTHAREGIMITDAAGTIIEINNRFTEITGYNREEAIGKNPRILKSDRQPKEFYAEMWKELLEKGHWFGELWNRHKNGNEYVESITISQVLDSSGAVKSYVALFTDITSMKVHQQQLEHIAHYDVLTNLPNRVLLADRLSQAMLHCPRSNKFLAVAFLDLDGFKAINDQYGHKVGDELLVNLTHRMKACLRESDTLARIGGDEFVAVLVGLEKEQDFEPLLMRLLDVTSSLVNINDSLLQVSASIGVTLYPQDDGDADQLLRHADQAMYIAKQLGKNRYHLFDIAQDIAVKTQRESIEHISAALDKKDFVLYYQPKVNMKTGAIIGVEALIRWQHPERGLLPPSVFLPVIENHALSITLGEWVLDSALTQIGLWQQSGLNIPISVNVSAHQLGSSNFVTRLAEILAAHHDVNPEMLELEILETSALEDITQISDLMRACVALGVNFALDDFGTGYSSLTYLKRLPVNMLKIDQSFVRDMIDDPEDLAIVKGVVGLAEAFHRKVIAEGVETIAHGTLLLNLGCELAQGYGIARPMPFSDIPEWVAKWKPDVAWRSES
ncbi:MAG: EAL domain-containing protein [Methylophilus sp.]